MRTLLLVGLLGWLSTGWTAQLLLSSLVDGQIVRQAVREGDVVKKGQLLLLVDPAAWQARREALVAQVAQRQAELENARLDLDEARDLYDRTVLARRELQRKELAFEKAHAALKQAAAALKAHDAMKRYYWVSAPRKGRVVKLHAIAGRTVYRGSPLLVMEVTE